LCRNPLLVSYVSAITSYCFFLRGIQNMK
jgi:hypothetical protein